MDVELAQLFVNGIAVGSIIALAAVGLTLTNGILRLPNFAHGDFMTLGAYLALLFDTQLLNFIAIPEQKIGAAIALGSILTIAFFLLSEYLIWKPMRNRRANSTTLIIISIGLALFIRNGIIFIWGGGNQNYDLPVQTALDIVGLKIRYNLMIAIGLAVLSVLVLHLLLQYTKIGKAMRAVADDLDLASVSGINVQRVVLWTWIVAGGLTALSGGLYALVQSPRPNMGWFLILPMFASIILGGIGNPYGAIVGALIIGIAQEVSTYWIPTEYKLAIALVVMVLVLLVKPQGLFRGTG
ncbi:branched-chain amino acid ABC transporter permease [Altericista sp. CCNU0014]|uniref:branched-chain amino acid ABC transporter permease n=1 Tax=Altericista sp. CCNU0014 TaxID=3082949 RepID=UPI00384B50AF